VRRSLGDRPKVSCGARRDWVDGGFLGKGKRGNSFLEGLGNCIDLRWKFVRFKALSK
jgi:hypothetical protein